MFCLLILLFFIRDVRQQLGKACLWRFLNQKVFVEISQPKNFGKVWGRSRACPTATHVGQLRGRQKHVGRELGLCQRLFYELIAQHSAPDSVNSSTFVTYCCVSSSVERKAPSRHKEITYIIVLHTIGSYWRKHCPEFQENSERHRSEWGSDPNLRF